MKNNKEVSNNINLNNLILLTFRKKLSYVFIFIAIIIGYYFDLNRKYIYDAKIPINILKISIEDNINCISKDFNCFNKSAYFRLKNSIIMNLQKKDSTSKIKMKKIVGNNIYLSSTKEIVPSALIKIFNNIENELILNEKENLRILEKLFIKMQVEKDSKSYSDISIISIIYNIESMKDYLNSERKLITFGKIKINENPINSTNFLVFIFFGFILSVLTTYTRITFLNNKK